jgi:predicted phosphodiesterase
MRIALLADIHGNELALNAVLRDIEARSGVNAYWILGDLVALGPQPVRVLEILSELPNTRFIRGNTDRYVVSGDRPSPSIEDAKSNSELMGALVEVANTFAWTQGMITAAGWLPWLQELPIELRIELPNGTRFLGVHASPGRDDGPGTVHI